MIRRHTISIKCALEGVQQALVTQPNFRVHLALSLISIIMAVVFRLNYWEWIILILVIIMGLVIEMINTAIESVVDLVSTEWRMSAKTAKDVAAGAMLIYALGAVLIAGLLFVPKILWLFI